MRCQRRSRIRLPVKPVNDEMANGKGNLLKAAVLKVANILGETGVYRYCCPGIMPVFMLHRVYDGEQAISGGLSADQLRSYLEYLTAKKFQVLTMGEVLRHLNERKPFPSRSVLFTIDDGFADHYEVAAKVFDEFGYSLNFFVITGLLDGQLWPWDDQLAFGIARTSVKKAELTLPSGESYGFKLGAQGIPQAIRELRDSLKTVDQQRIYHWIKNDLYRVLNVPFPTTIPPEYSPMSWDDAKALQTRGHGVYPHTQSHRILSTLSSVEKREEISGSLARLAEELECSPKAFAYPTGRISDYDRKDMEELKLAGYELAFNTVPAYLSLDCDHYQLPRFSLPEKMPEFLQIINRFEALKTKIRA